jgi:hypothetical protein
MNDDEIESHLRSLPAPELPESWRAEILANAWCKGREPESARGIWPPVFIALRNLFARNPVSASVLAALWFLILFFRFDTSIDPDEKELLVHDDPRQPIYFVPVGEQIQLAEMLQDTPEGSREPRIP